MMEAETGTRRSRRALEVGSNLMSAFRDLLDQEFTFSSGHLTAVLNTCLFAPSILTFWFVNGVIDFSTAFIVGSAGSGAGLLVRVYAYLLVVPTFLLLRVSVHLAHPRHRQEILSGRCPTTQLMSLDWFTVGILATGLPLALQDLGPWVAMNLVFLLGVFVVPRPMARRPALATKFGALIAGSVLFVYAKYGSLLPVGPRPAAVIGPVATLVLSDATTAALMTAVNSLLVGPVVVAVFGVGMNRLLTRHELKEIPYVRHTLPGRDPDPVVFVSAALGTVFYLVVVATATGRIVFVP